MRNCDSEKICLHISQSTKCEDVARDHCECVYGQHRHFMSVGDRKAALLALVPPKAEA